MRRSLAAFAAVLFLAACSPDEPDPSEEPSSPEATSAEATTEEPTPEAAELTVGGGQVLGVTAGETSYDYNVTDIYAEQVDGVDHVLAAVTITVTEGELSFLAGWSALLTPVLESGGVEFEQSMYETPDMLDGVVSAGETVSGTVGFEAPSAAAETGVYRLELLSMQGDVVHEWSY